MKILQHLIHRTGSGLEKNFSTPQPQPDASKDGLKNYKRLTQSEIEKVVVEAERYANNPICNTQAGTIINQLVSIIRWLLSEVEYLNYDKDTRD